MAGFRFEALRRLAVGGVWIVIGVGAAIEARAGTFEVKDTDVERGQTEIGTNNAFFSGYPANADTVRFSNEISIARGMTSWWLAAVKANGDKDVDGSFKYGTVGTEHIITLRKFGNGFGIALYGGVDVAVANEATNAFNFGPILKFGSDELSFGLNTFFTRTFGQNRSNGVDFSYSWNVKREVREGFSVGIEGHGAIADIAHAQGLAFQEHRIGPVLYFEKPLGKAGASGKPMKLGVKEPAADKEGADGPKLAVEAGVFFGLTDGTQDRAYKLKGAIQF